MVAVESPGRGPGVLAEWAAGRVTGVPSAAPAGGRGGVRADPGKPPALGGDEGAGVAGGPVAPIDGGGVLTRHRRGVEAGEVPDDLLRRNPFDWRDRARAGREGRIRDADGG